MRSLFYSKRCNAEARLLADIAGAVTPAVNPKSQSSIVAVRQSAGDITGKYLAVILVLMAITFPASTRASVDFAPAAGHETQLVEHYPLELPEHAELEDHRLELLMSYTVFHIGLYMSLIAAVIATFEIKKTVFSPLAVKQAMVCFLVAGACGGIIAINVAEYDVRIHPVSDFYHDYPLTVLWWSGGCFLKYPILEHLEHIAFWTGTLRLFVSFICRPRTS